MTHQARPSHGRVETQGQRPAEWHQSWPHPSHHGVDERDEPDRDALDPDDEPEAEIMLETLRESVEGIEPIEPMVVAEPEPEPGV
jgi:hypothetical protein